MKTKDRKIWIAVLMSLFFPGLGQLYCGEARRGIIIYFGYLLVVFVSYFAALIPVAVGNLILCISIYCGYYLFFLIDAFRVANKNKIFYKLKTYNRLYVYLLIALVTSFIIEPFPNYLLKKHLIRAYKIPFGDMKPILMIGDYVLANKFIYMIKEPERNDIVVLSYQSEPLKVFLHRIIALPGEIVEIRDKKIIVNNSVIDDTDRLYDGSRKASELVKHRDTFGPTTVPSESFFVLGDNRDNSYDSRFLGFVNRNDIRGKIGTVYWSWDIKNKIVRWNRIGKIVK